MQCFVAPGFNDVDWRFSPRFGVSSYFIATCFDASFDAGRADPLKMNLQKSPCCSHVLLDFLKKRTILDLLYFKRINDVVLRFLVLRKQHFRFGRHGVMYKISGSLYLVNVVIIVFIIISLVCDVVQPFRDQPFCGHSEGFANHRQPRRRGKIINGVEANKEAWPWQVCFNLKEIDGTMCLTNEKKKKKLENILHHLFLELMPSQV